MDDKTPIDITAGMVAFGAVMDVLPALASLFTIIWMAVRIYQSILEIMERRRDRNDGNTS
jgi:hypothetical protein